METRLAVLGIALLLQCAALMVPAGASGGGETRITIDLRDEKQVMHSFGASDCWTCQFVGKDWPLEKRNAIADLLFSRDVDSKGNPKGIALSMWRFNLGAGSAEQGGASGIGSPWHRSECFQNKDGAYDWEKQQGQRWFLEAAHSRGVPYLLAFTNSPPVQFTLNGLARSDAGRSALNIRPGAMPGFADFLVDVAERFGKKGIPFNYISPINEPQYGWDSEKQEGSPANNADIAEVTRLVADRLRARGVSSKVVVGEAGNLEYLLGTRRDVDRRDQVRAFWSPASPEYLGNQPDSVAHAISAHSYFTTWPIAKQIETREKLRDRIAKIDPKLAFWQTEFCILEKSDEIGQGHKRDLGMDTALYVARVIHSDLTIANATHWSWWLAVTQSDYKDGLVYLVKDDKTAQGDDPLRRDGQVMPSKLLWALGNFSRFVRPGMVRVGVSREPAQTPLEAATGLMVSAYLDKKTRQIAVVAINCASEEQTVSLAKLKIRANSFATYTTSQSSDLAKGKTPADRISVPARSVVTLVGEVE